MRKLIAALILAVAAACSYYEVEGPDAQGYKWHNDGPKVSAENVEYHVGVDVFLNCRMELHAKSCSVQGRGDGKCHVYLPADYEPWMKLHEEKHCAGWRHPDPLRQPGNRPPGGRVT